MTEKQKTAPKTNQSATPTPDKQSNCAAGEAVVWEAVKQARQNVKPIVRKERQAETASAELLNLRLKAAR